MRLRVFRSREGQAMPPPTVKIEKEFFEKNEYTDIRWLGTAGILINCHGTVIAIDPLLAAYDLPLLQEMPITSAEIPYLDAVLITHIDGDHYSTATCDELKGKTAGFHAPGYVADDMGMRGYPAFKHRIEEPFQPGNMTVTLTPVEHDWQNGVPQFQFRHWEKYDYCGYRIDTPEGRIWMVGDSRLIEEQLYQPEPDVILFDLSDDGYHIGFENAVKLANHYPKADLLCIHWGTMDAPKALPFNADPTRLISRVSDPERIKVTALGEPFILKKQGV